MLRHPEGLDVKVLLHDFHDFKKLTAMSLLGSLQVSSNQILLSPLLLQRDINMEKQSSGNKNVKACGFSVISTKGVTATVVKRW